MKNFILLFALLSTSSFSFSQTSCQSNSGSSPTVGVFTIGQVITMNSCAGEYIHSIELQQHGSYADAQITKVEIFEGNSINFTDLIYSSNTILELPDNDGEYYSIEFNDGICFAKGKECLQFIDGEQFTIYIHYGNTNNTWGNKLDNTDSYPGGNLYFSGVSQTSLDLGFDLMTTVENPLSAILPVELQSFKANVNGHDVQLDWQTASELNNSHFVVEHSTDGQRFFEIGEEAGVGTTNAIQNYNFLHEEVENGLHYYRLKQVDFDGKFEYSNIIIAEISHSNDDIFLTPNPSSNMVLIQTKAPYQRDADFQILNMQGQVVMSNILQEGDTDMVLNISDFPVGIYYLKLYVDNDMLMKKIIKN